MVHLEHISRLEQQLRTPAIRDNWEDMFGLGSLVDIYIMLCLCCLTARVAKKLIRWFIACAV